MDTGVASSHANLIIRFQTNYLQTILFLHVQPLIYFGHVDDVFLIWGHDQQSLQEFFSRFSFLTFNWNIECHYIFGCKLFSKNQLMSTKIHNYINPTNATQYVHTLQENTIQIANEYCKNCPKDFTGETSTRLRIRINNPRFDVSHGNINRPVSEHVISLEKSFEECFKVEDN